MKKRLYIDAWGEIPKKEAKRLQVVGENGIFSFRLDSANIHTTIYRLAKHLGLGPGSETSYYGLFIPPNNDEVIKLRLSDHKSSPSEWPERELYLPNRRYSIVVFNSKSMHFQYSNNCEYIDWTPYDVEGIYVYELCINCKYLIKYWAFLRQILRGIYNGENVENNSIESYAISLKGYESSNDVVHDWNKTVDKITENQQDTNMKTENRKRNVVRLTESQLKQMIAESVKKVLNEGEYLNNKPLFVDEPIYYDDGTTSTVSMLNKEIRKQIYNAPEVQNYKSFLLKHGVSRNDIGEHLFDMYELIEKVLSQKQQQE